MQLLVIANIPPLCVIIGDASSRGIEADGSHLSCE